MLYKVAHSCRENRQAPPLPDNLQRNILHLQFVPRKFLLNAQGVDIKECLLPSVRGCCPNPASASAIRIAEFSLFCISLFFMLVQGIVVSNRRTFSRKAKKVRSSLVICPEAGTGSGSMLFPAHPRSSNNRSYPGWFRSDPAQWSKAFTPTYLLLETALPRQLPDSSTWFPGRPARPS